MPDRGTSPETQDALQPRSVPQQKRSVERRQAILDATLALLRTHSPQAITTSLIAAAAGLPVSSLYAYFPNKESVFAELMRAALDEVDSQLEAMLPQLGTLSDISGAVDALINAVLTGYGAMPERRRLFGGLRGDPKLDHLLRASDARMVAAVRDNLVRLRPDLPPRRIAAIAQTTVYAFTALQENALRCDDAGAFDDLVTEWRRMMTAYLAPLAMA